jgi:hypothetical protein
MARIGAHLSRIHCGPPRSPPADCAKASKQSPRRNWARSLLFRSLTGHAFTSKYTQRFHTGRAPSACECGFGPQTVNHVVFGCSRYTAARSGSPRFDLDFRTGRPIKRLCGLLRDGDSTGASLRFLEATNGCFRSRSLRDPGWTWHPFLFFHISELGGLGLNQPGSRCLHFPLIPFHHSVPRASHCSPVVSHFVCSPKLE